jgi:membrane protein, antimicrobial resistance system
MEEQNSSEWQAPPPPERIQAGEPAQMSEVGTLGSIFFEPGRTFEDLRRKPRFLMAAVIMALLVFGYVIGLQYKFGESGMRSFIADQIEKNPRTGGLTAEQKANAVDLQVKISSYTRYAIPIFVLVAFLIGGLLYWGGSKAFGGDGGFLHGLSVFVYSSFPPTVVGMIANYIVMALKSVDEIDLATSQRSLLNANLGFFVNGHEAPVLATLLSTLDLFAIWGWILAAIGLRITNRLSSGSSWAVVIIIAIIGVLFRVVGAWFSGNPS